MNVTHIREFFLQREAEARARARAPEVERFLRAAAEAGARRARVADAHAGPGDAVVAFELYYDAALLLALAQRVDADGEVPADTSRAGAQPILDTWLASHGGTVDAPAPWADLTHAPAADLEAKNARLAEACRALSRSVDLRSPFAVRATRYARFAALLVLLVYAAWPLVDRLRRGANVALGAQVTASSHFPGTPDPSGVVNGTVEAQFGGHTTKEADAWIRVDLGSERDLAEVRVFPRGDGYADESLPVVLETSSDGATFVVVATRREPYSQRSPWIIRAPMHLRYLRVRMPGMGYVALSEIEAYQR